MHQGGHQTGVWSNGNHASAASGVQSNFKLSDVIHKCSKVVSLSHLQYSPSHHSPRPHCCPFPFPVNRESPRHLEKQDPSVAADVIIIR